MSKRNRNRILLWGLYDFANSFAYANVSFYFGLWFISEHHASDGWMSASVAVVTLVLLLVLPMLGRFSDRVHRRMPFLAACTLLTIATLLTLGLFMQSVTVLTPTATVFVFVLYTLFNMFYMSSFAFYDAFIRDLAFGGGSMEKISAFGMSMGQIGNVVGLIVVLPLASGSIAPFGFSGAPAAFIAGALFFLFFSLPTLLFLRESQPAVTDHIGQSFRETLRHLRHLKDYPGVLPFLLTYCLFADALLTLQLFTSFYLKTVGHLDELQSTLTVITAIVSGIVGALVSPLLIRFFGTTKRAMSVSIAMWALVLGGFAFAQIPWLLTLLVALNGFAFGVIFSLSRAFYARLVPERKQAEMFSIYALFERTASIIGPLLWSATAVVFSSFGDDRYRFSVLSLAVLLTVSLVVFQYVREPKR